jgi:hypothetical protein
MIDHSDPLAVKRASQANRKLRLARRSLVETIAPTFPHHLKIVCTLQ